MDQRIWMGAIIYIILSSILLSCSSVKQTAARNGQSSVKLDTLTLFDQSRHRNIPIAIYTRESTHKVQKQPIVILNHGYGANRDGSYLAYSYLNEFLASQGYFVISIQHELASDALIPAKGIPQVVRRPFWDRGAANIFYVISYLKGDYSQLDFSHVTLIGHSNGGDIVALFTQMHPNLVDKIITLDNRRMALPRTSNPRIYSLRSSDLPADPGVLPTSLEQQVYNINIIKLSNTMHNDMDDKATEVQRKEIRDYIMSFLND